MRWVPLAVRSSLFALAINTLTGTACAQAGSDAAPNTATTPAAREGAALQLHEQFLERAAEGELDLLFLGDSITQGWNENPVWQRYYGPRHAANFGIGGDRTQHVLWRLDHGEIEGIAPKAVVLMIGTNNIGSNSAEEIAEGVEAIVDKLIAELPETRILLLGVFPRGQTRSSDLQADALDPRVAQINELIAPLGERERVHYLDIGENFLDDKGMIPREVMPDFLHLSRKGYRIWAESMEPTLWEILEEDRGR